MPNLNDDAMTAVLSKLRPRATRMTTSPSGPKVREAKLSPLFPGLLHLFPHPNTNPERIQQMARFFSGGKLSFANVRQWLREVGAVKLFPLKTIKQPDLIVNSCVSCRA